MLLKSLGKYGDLGLLVLRIGLGCMFLYHGFPKLFGGPEKWMKLGSAMKYIGIETLPVFWGFAASFVEFFGAFAIIFGFFFRPTCALMTCIMAVAAAMHLGKGDPFLAATHAIEDGIVFLSLILIGPGKISIDRK